MKTFEVSGKAYNQLLDACLIRRLFLGRSFEDKTIGLLLRKTELLGLLLLAVSRGS